MGSIPTRPTPPTTWWRGCTPPGTVDRAVSAVTAIITTKCRANRRPRRAALALLVVGAAAGCGGSSSPIVEMAGFAAGPPAAAPGGFEVDVHGLAFPNYASERGFTVSDAVEMFGADAVCGSDDATCTVDARALAWIDTVSASMAGGVCEGMVLFSLDRFVAGVEPAAGQLAQDEAVESRIAQLFATQFLPTVGDATRAGRDLGLEGLVRRIEQGLAEGGDPVTIGVYSSGAGHALLPFAVDRLDDARVVVGVYDVNWPGAARALEVDLGSGSWRYSIDSADQAGDASAWVGDASTIDLTPLSARAQLASGPFTVEAGRSVLTVTFRGGGWSVTVGGSVIDPGTVTVGEAGVAAVARGAFDATTLVLDPVGEVVVSSPGPMQFGAQMPSGWLTTRADSAATVAVDPVRAALNVVEGAVEVRTATERGAVELVARAGMTVAIVEEGVGIDDGQGGTVVAEQPAGARTDWVVGDDGGLIESAPLQLPASARSGATDGATATTPSVAGTSTTNPLAGGSSTSSPTPGPTTVPTSTTASPAPTTSSLPPATTSPSPVTTSPSPATTSPPPVTTSPPPPPSLPPSITAVPSPDP